MSSLAIGSFMGMEHMNTEICRSISALIVSAILVLSPAVAGAETKPLRVAVVNTPQFSGLMDVLIADFKTATGTDVTVYSGSDVFERAKNGEADVVIAHYGKPEMEDFVLKGYGAWPRMVFSNQMVIIGPPEDLAHIRGLSSGADALKKIAETKSPFIANALPGVAYLTSLFLEMAGSPEKKGWYLDEGLEKGRAIRAATANRAYVIFGAWPFLRIKKKQGSDLEILVASDPLLQRVMASVVVHPDKVAGVDQPGALAFQKFLLSPASQARIAAFRSPESSLQLWWPAGRDNDNGFLDD